MRIHEVTFSYGEKIVLERLSLTLPGTGVTALAGPSGCGKTTLLKLLAGILKPDAGLIDAPSEIAILFQENRLLPGLDAVGQLQAVLPKGAAAEPWLKKVGLEAELHSPISSLSGGMRRRVALARCMAYGADKKLLLLDEPFTGVDPETAADIMGEIRQTGIPVILSAHDAESLALADRVIRFDGPPLRVRDP